MRYIRLFEETTNQYYWTITRDEYDEVMDYASLSETTKLIDFSHESKMDRWIESQPGFRKESGQYAIPSSKSFFIGEKHYFKRGLQKINGVMAYKLETMNHNEYESVYIFESEDEWFWVRIFTEECRTRPIRYGNESHYKCDQFDGIKKLLTDKIFQG